MRTPKFVASRSGAWGLCKPPELVAGVLSEDSLVGDSALNVWKPLTPGSWVRIALQALRAQGGKKTVRDVMGDLGADFWLYHRLAL